MIFHFQCVFVCVCQRETVIDREWKCQMLFLLKYNMVVMAPQKISAPGPIAVL